MTQWPGHWTPGLDDNDMNKDRTFMKTDWRVRSPWNAGDIIIYRKFGYPNKLVEVGDWVIINDNGTFFDDLNYLKSI